MVVNIGGPSCPGTSCKNITKLNQSLFTYVVFWWQFFFSVLSKQLKKKRKILVKLIKLNYKWKELEPKKHGLATASTGMWHTAYVFAQFWKLHTGEIFFLSNCSVIYLTSHDLTNISETNLIRCYHLHGNVVHGAPRLQTARVRLEMIWGPFDPLSGARDLCVLKNPTR